MDEETEKFLFLDEEKIGSEYSALRQRRGKRSDASMTIRQVTARTTITTNTIKTRTTNSDAL